jgi:hypothetical protein
MDPEIERKCLRFEELASRQEDLSASEWDEFDVLAAWLADHDADYRIFHAKRGS